MTGAGGAGGAGGAAGGRSDRSDRRGHSFPHLLRILGWFVLALVLFVLAVALEGQERAPARAGRVVGQQQAAVPRQAPPAEFSSSQAGLEWKPPDRVEFALLAADAGVRALDVYSTQRMLQRGNRELFLPRFVANHPPVMAAGFAGIVGLNYFAARKLEQHGHRQWARVVVMVDIAQDAPWAVHNLWLPRHPATQK